MDKLYSNIADADYSFAMMTVRELRNKIIQQDNLTVLDIAKGFRAIQPVKLTYETTSPEVYADDIKVIHDEYRRFVKDELPTILSAMAKEKYQEGLKAVEEIRKKMEEEKYYLYNGDDAATCLYKVVNRFSDTKPYGNNRTYGSYDSEISRVYHTSIYIDNEVVCSIIQEHMNKFISDKFNEQYTTNPKCVFTNYVNLNMKNDIDFSELYENIGKIYFGEKLEDSFEGQSISLDSPVQPTFDYKHIYPYGNFGLYRKIPEEIGKKRFNDAVWNKVSSESSMNINAFYRNTEVMPVIINRDTVKNKIQLIDGYRRILTISDPKLLDLQIPIKVFTDLNDNQFLSVLYSANQWKRLGKIYDTEIRNAYNYATEVNFHDRGFLFALKERFGFELPEEAYSSNSLHCMDYLKVYDFGGCLGLKKNPLSEEDSLKLHYHYVDDIRILYDTLLKCHNTQYPYDKQYNKALTETILSALHVIRHQSYQKEEKPLTPEMITSLFEDKHLTEMFRKKTYSSDTYVENFMRTKNINTYVYEKFENALIPERFLNKDAKSDEKDDIEEDEILER